MTAEACDASFAWAPRFFARHFPEDDYRVATCGSWLLDEQLAEYLPETSNIVQFQRRFRLVPPDGFEPRSALPLDELEKLVDRLRVPGEADGGGDQGGGKAEY